MGMDKSSYRPVMLCRRQPPKSIPRSKEAEKSEKTVYETALNFYLESLNHKFTDPAEVEQLLWNHVNQTCLIENTRPWNWVYPRNRDPASRTDSENWRKPRPDTGAH